MRIVSLVPSLTESLWELGVGPALVGVTRFCERPPEARERAVVIGGTKDPDVERIQSLRPDLVVADEDENKPEHLEALRKNTTVLVTRIESVGDVAQELARVGAAVGRAHDAEARAQRILERAAELRGLTGVFPRVRVFVPIWRKPVMTLNGRTYMSDLLAVAGAENVFTSAPTKYFETSYSEVRARQPEAVLLPTEPYRFGSVHRAEYAQALDLSIERVRLVDGQAFTWFGCRTLEGLDVVAEAVRAVRSAPASKVL